MKSGSSRRTFFRVHLITQASTARRSGIAVGVGRGLRVRIGFVSSDIPGDGFFTASTGAPAAACPIWQVNYSPHGRCWTTRRYSIGGVTPKLSGKRLPLSLLMPSDSCCYVQPPSAPWMRLWRPFQPRSDGIAGCNYPGMCNCVAIRRGLHSGPEALATRVVDVKIARRSGR